MLYVAEILFINGKYSDNQTRTNLKCAKGVIHKVEIDFPQGCANLVNVQLYLNEHPILPSTQGQKLKGNDETIIIPEFIELENSNNIITIRGWNEDDIYDHTVLVRIYVLPKTILMNTGIAEGFVTALSSILKTPSFPGG